MSNDLSSLNDEHIRQLGRIIDTLEKSTFDFLQIEVGELKVTVGKGDMPVPDPSAASSRPAPVAAPPSLPSAPPPAAAPTPAAPAQQPQAPVSSQPGTTEIRAPIMGMFYAQPEPGAAPFVTVGATVTEDMTVGLVEVMKTFNAVVAGVRGTIVEICVPDAQLVEYGQALFRVSQD